MRKLSLTPKNIEFIKRNRLKMSGSEMAEKLNVGKGVVTRYMRVTGLAVSPERQKQFRIAAAVKRLSGSTSSTPEMDCEIKKRYLDLPSKTLAKQLGRSDTFIRTRLKQLGLTIPKEIIEKRKADSRLKPGNVPPNKGKKMSKAQYKKCKHTMFRKGHVPVNTKERDGCITIRNDHMNRRGGRQYKYIRLSVGVWMPLHQYKWEKYRGEVPPGHCLWFKDGNSLNCTIKNLEVITRAENARRNRGAFLTLPPELQTTKQIINQLNKKLISHEKQNKRS